MNEQELKGLIEAVDHRSMSIIDQLKSEDVREGLIEFPKAWSQEKDFQELITLSKVKSILLYYRAYYHNRDIRRKRE